MKKSEMIANSRKTITNLGYTFLHWLLVVILGAISFVVQFSFMIDTGEDYSSFIFSGEVYSINFFTYLIGIALFVVGYYIMWKKYLVVDWNGFKGQFWLWKFTYVIIALVALVAIFAVALLIIASHVGLSVDVRPEWTMWGSVALPVYAVIFSIVDLFHSKF